MGIQTADTAVLLATMSNTIALQCQNQRCRKVTMTSANFLALAIAEYHCQQCGSNLTPSLWPAEGYGWPAEVPSVARKICASPTALQKVTVA